MRTASKWWAAVLAVMVVAGGCSSPEVEPDGPLRLLDVYGNEAAQDGPSGDEVAFAAATVPLDMTVTSGTLTNDGDEPLTVVSVTALGAKSVKTLDAVLFPPPKKGDKETRIAYPGFISSFPAKDRDGRRWDEHVPAKGATIEPGARWVLAVGLQADADKGSVQRFRIEYTDPDGQRYEVFSAQSVKVIPPAKPVDPGIPLDGQEDSHSHEGDGHSHEDEGHSHGG